MIEKCKGLLSLVQGPRDHRAVGWWVAAPSSTLGAAKWYSQSPLGGGKERL